jgi:hypothetical protein
MKKTVLLVLILIGIIAITHAYAEETATAPAKQAGAT